MSSSLSSTKRHSLTSTRPRNVDALAIRAVAWDLDGTLVDTERGYFRAWEQVYRHHGIPLPRMLWDEMMSLNKDPGIVLGESWGVHVSDAERRFIARNVTREIRAAEPMAGALDRLHECRSRGVLNCLVTNGSREWQDTVLPRRLHRLIDYTFTLDDFGVGKPSPIPHLSACDALGLLPQQVVGIEDSVRGMTAVRGAGMPGILVSSDVRFPGVPRYSSLAEFDLDAMNDHVLGSSAFQPWSTPSSPSLMPSFRPGFAL